MLPGITVEPYSFPAESKASPDTPSPSGIVTNPTNSCDSSICQSFTIPPGRCPCTPVLANISPAVAGVVATL